MVDDEPGPERDPEIIDANRHLVLGASESFYGIWDKRGKGEPLARFPVTEEGFVQAESRFRELSRRPWIPAVLTRPLTFGLYGGLAAWLLIGTLNGVLSAVGNVYGPALDVLYRVTGAIEGMAFRFWVASLIALAGIWLLERIRDPR